LQSAVQPDLDHILTDFLTAQKLPETYRAIAMRWFVPVLEKLAVLTAKLEKPLFVGINGCQGSGKSTLAALAVAYFKTLHRKNSVAISIDDFYLTLGQRQKLAERVHPLLRTRGVPGTHDLELARKTLDAMAAGQGPVLIPRFNKAADDREPESAWSTTKTPVDIVIIEGWCMGASPQTADQLHLPVNELEQFEDRSGVWREYVNHHLATDYADLFRRIDKWVMLKAPSFDCVYRWRLEQEEKLRASLAAKPRDKANDHLMSPQQIRRFIQYYQRVTEHALNTLPQEAQVVFEMDSNRQIFKLHDTL